MSKTYVELVDQFLRSVSNDGAWRENRFGTSLIKSIIILRRDDTADHDHDVVAATLCQCSFDFRHRREMGCGEGRQAPACARRFPRPGGRLRRRWRTAARYRRRSRRRRRRMQSLSGRGHGHPGRSWRPGCGAFGLRLPRRRRSIPEPSEPGWTWWQPRVCRRR